MEYIFPPYHFRDFRPFFMVQKTGVALRNLWGLYEYLVISVDVRPYFTGIAL